MIALRRSEPALRDGRYVPLDRENPFVLSFLRKKPGSNDAVLVVLNMSAESRTVKFDLAAEGVKESSARLLIAAPETGLEPKLVHFTIPAFGVFVGSVH
jgi:alpha-glucosidase